MKIKNEKTGLFVKELLNDEVIYSEHEEDGIEFEEDDFENALIDLKDVAPSDDFVGHRPPKP